MANKKFRFWKENRIDQEFGLTATELIEKYLTWIKSKRPEWVEYYYNDETITRAFITEKEGLNSVFEEADLSELMDIFHPYLTAHYAKHVDNSKK